MLDAVAEVVRRVTGSAAAGARPAQDLAATLAAAGWTLEGPPTPFTGRWVAGGLQARLLTEQDDDVVALIEFVFHIVEPDWDSPVYSDAMDNEYEAQLAQLEELKADLRGALETRGVELIPYPDVKEDAVDFIESECWQIGHSPAFYLTVGVAHTDEDLPILTLARLRFG